MRPGKVDHCFSASKGTIKVSLVLTIPEPGQLVDVRQRRYVVVDVVEGTLPLDPLKVESLSQSSQHSQRQHLISLASVEDDDLGEELQVIWEVEPGVKVTERNALPVPVGFDAPERLDTFLNAVRWGAVSSADIKSLISNFARKSGSGEACCAGSLATFRPFNSRTTAATSFRKSTSS